MKIFPKVFKSNKTQKVYFQAEEAYEAVAIKIQPMEAYTVPHSPIYRIDEEERYPYIPMEKDKDGVFFVSYPFAQEQRYNVKIKAGEEIIFVTYAYAIDEDLSVLKPYKGDTHLHTNHSDGAYEPFETACCYRGAGYDFIAVTDHHKWYPSLECKEKVEALTDTFTVFLGEEVHNRGMGYFHIINFGGKTSVNVPILADPDKIEEEVQKILSSRDFTGAADPYACAYRIFVAEEIRKGGGLAIMAHPYWHCYGEYNMQTEDFRYLWKNGCFDALEVLADCDVFENGSNLQNALWSDMRAEGAVIPVVGASDCHDAKDENSFFNRHFTVVLAKNPDDIKQAIKEERSVAVLRKGENDLFVFGRFRYVKYVRFLLEEYAPAYDKLTKKHAEALRESSKRTTKIRDIEREILEYQTEFFN